MDITLRAHFLNYITCHASTMSQTLLSLGTPTPSSCCETCRPPAVLEAEGEEEVGAGLVEKEMKKDRTGRRRVRQRRRRTGSGEGREDVIGPPSSVTSRIPPLSKVPQATTLPPGPCLW